MGRLFDGVAALLGVCGYAEYEAHGPIELEGLLSRDLELTDPYSFGRMARAGVAELDFRAVIRGLAADLAKGTDLRDLSRRFHSSVVSMVLSQCEAVREEYGVEQVVLSGGVFLNEFVLVNCLVALTRAGFGAYAHRRVPANDGGIALGQAIVAAARIAGQAAQFPDEGGR
jgi:hydrogenase maturation protein HypF